MTIRHSRHFSKLASDYIAGSNALALSEFFAIPQAQYSEYFPALFETITRREQTFPAKRRDIIESIRSYHSKHSILTEAVSRNLELFASDRTYAVVTGQQTGILGGPLYTYYKAMHTVLLAHHYSSEFPDSHFVPIFWQETEDHDLDEAAVTVVNGKDGQLHRIRYTPNGDVSRMQVGHLQLESEPLDKLFQSISEVLLQTEFTDNVLALYRDCYSPGLTFAQAQARFLGKLLADKGLLILDANSPTLKRYASKVFHTEITDAPKTSNIVNSTGAKLVTLGYHSQLHLNGINLFVLNDSRREKLLVDNFDKDRLLTLAAEGPHKLSPNVALRPIVQDTLLPTVAYIAGPGEIAYFAQLKDVYRHFDVPMPLIVPRLSLTIAEDKHLKLCRKYSVDIDDLIERGYDLVAEILSSEQEQKIKERFGIAMDGLDKSLELVRAAVRAAEPTLDAALTTLKGKLLSGVKDFEGKTLAAERKKSADVKRQFLIALNVLLPEDKLQERTLSLLYFLNKYGMDFPKFLEKSISKIPNSDHQLIPITDIISIR